MTTYARVVVLSPRPETAEQLLRSVADVGSVTSQPGGHQTGVLALGSVRGVDVAIGLIVPGAGAEAFEAQLRSADALLLVFPDSLAEREHLVAWLGGVDGALAALGRPRIKARFRRPDDVEATTPWVAYVDRYSAADPAPQGDVEALLGDAGDLVFGRIDDGSLGGLVKRVARTAVATLKKGDARPFP